MQKNQCFLNFFYKTEAGHVLKMFLQFWLISASRSYKLGSYKKKTCMLDKKIQTQFFYDPVPVLRRFARRSVFKMWPRFSIRVLWERKKETKIILNRFESTDFDGTTTIGFHFLSSFIYVCTAWLVEQETACQSNVESNFFRKQL